MKTTIEQKDQFLISFADICRLFRKSRKTILYWALTAGLLGMAYALLKPIHYEAEGTFREKGIKSNQVSSASIMQMLSSGNLSGSESEAASLLVSRRILQDVIQKLHLQGNLIAISDRETLPKRVKRNLSSDWAFYRGSPLPALSDPCCQLKIESLSYTGEIPMALGIHLEANGEFEVRDQSNGKMLERRGRLGEPFSVEALTFTIVPSQFGKEMTPQAYLLAIDSLYNTAQRLSKALTVEPAKLDKTLLKMKMVHRDRKIASTIVNTTMESYRDYLKGYHAEIATQQLDYLNERRGQLASNLNQSMQRHADYLTHDLSHSGFLEASKEMDFLARGQHEYKQKLLDNELEKKRLNTIKPGALAYYHRYTSNEADPAFINNILSEMRSLRQQRDALEIELQKKSAHQGANLQLSFEEQLKELNGVQHDLRELHQADELFQEGKLTEDAAIVNNSRFLLKGWLERIQKAEGLNDDAVKETKEHFQNYLNNLERSLGVHERILQERLTHQQNPSEEYKGISLEVATDLYLDYSKQLVEIERKIRENLFFIHQLDDPHFEITSLSSGLGDEVSRRMIEKANDLLLNLKDETNQSHREQERIKTELELQRTFLTMHLKQMVQLMELNQELIDEKILALQNVSLELIHERISLLEKGLQDYLNSRLNNLDQERLLVQRHLDSIHTQMAALPQKWVSEQLLRQEVDTNQKIAEEIAKLVESKNISHNLEVIQSAPIDVAVPPVHPKPPHALLWGLLGFCLGGFLGSTYVLGKTLKRGVPVTMENLRLMGFHVSGTSMDAETVRRLQNYADGAKTLLLLEGQGPHYAPELGDLFLKCGKRVLMMDLDCHDSYKIASPGLLQYLEGTLPHLPIRKGQHGDWVGPGGASAHLVNLIQTPSFAGLIDQLKTQYDLILAFSPLAPTSAEAESLLAVFPWAALTLTDETTEDLAFLSRLETLYPSHSFTFILNEEIIN